MTLHNLHFYLELMRRAGREIEAGNFDRIPARICRRIPKQN